MYIVLSEKSRLGPFHVIYVVVFVTMESADRGMLFSFGPFWRDLEGFQTQRAMAKSGSTDLVQ